MKPKVIFLLLLATLANLAITIVYFVAFLLLSLYLLGDSLEQYASAIILLPLLLSLVASFFSYRALLNWADRKWQIKRYFERR